MPEQRGAYLFAYGSLRLPEVMKAVTGLDFQSESAVLDDYLRRLVVGRTYPGLIVQPGERTDGCVYRGIDPESFRALDMFEGPLYERCEVVPIRASGIPVAAYTYVVRPQRTAVLTNEPWDVDAFRARHFDSFLRSCEGFRRQRLAAVPDEER